MTARGLETSTEVTDETVAWYDRSADAYIADTLLRNPTDLRSEFMQRMPDEGFILDAGSGSGRDTLAFLEAGFQVDAFDASEALARSSSKLTGKQTQVVRFETYAGSRDRYDGVWAFASLLHVREADLPGVLSRLAFTLKPGGWLFANFKLGSKERIDGFGRRYTDMTAERMADIFEPLPDWTELEFDIQFAEAAFSQPTGWLNVWARKRLAASAMADICAGDSQSTISR